MGFLNVLKKPITVQSNIFKPINSSTYDCIKPVHYILVKYSEKQFYTGTETINGVPATPLAIVGNDLVIGLAYDQVSRTTLVDCNFKVIDDSLVVNDSLVISTNVQQLYKTCLMSCFEFISIYKNLTGLLISNIGLSMNEIHLVLSNKYNYKDWCYIKKLNDDSSNWYKCWCHIDRNNDKKNNNRIKFYRDQSLKDLIAVVGNNPTDLFATVAMGSAAPDDLHTFVNQLSAVKLLGNVKYTNNPLEKDAESQTETSSSNSRGSNVNGTGAKKLLSPLHKRSISISTMFSNSSSSSTGSPVKIKKKTFDTVDDPQGLLIKPIPHNGISHLDTVVKLIIPMIDCLHKYGRPEKFRFSTDDPDSLMFALPKLPETNYLSYQLQESFVASQVDGSDSASTTSDVSTDTQELEPTSNRIAMNNLKKLIIKSLSS